MALKRRRSVGGHCGRLLSTSQHESRSEEGELREREREICEDRLNRQMTHKITS
jgi:hypothetical protein